MYSPSHRTYQFSKTRKRVKERDGNKCALSGVTENLNVHHIESGKARPDLFNVDSNCITISKKLHVIYHTCYLDDYSVIATRDSWNKFVELYNRLVIE